MSANIQNNQKQQHKMSGFDYVMEVAGWLQIVASPLLAGLIIGAIIYLTDPGNVRLTMAILVALIGLILGIFLATRVWRKHGTMHFVSRAMATPELDNVEEKEKSVEKK